MEINKKWNRSQMKYIDIQNIKQNFEKYFQLLGDLNFSINCFIVKVNLISL